MTRDIEYLNRAIENYGKGYKINNNYYTGENYALCLNLKAKIETDENEIIYSKVEAQKTRKNIIAILEELISSEEFIKNPDKWVFATLAHCYFSVGNSKADEFENKFLQLVNIDWERNTYLNGKEKLTELLK